MAGAPNGRDRPGDTPGLTLSEPERRLLIELRGHPEVPFEEAEIAERVGLTEDAVRGALQRLRSKHLAVVEEENLEDRRLTPRGERALQEGLPERRLLNAVRDAGGSLGPDSPRWKEIPDDERSPAIGVLRRRGFLGEGMPLRLSPTATDLNRPFPEERLLVAVRDGEEEVDEGVLSGMKRRGLVALLHRSVKRWSASEEGRALPVAEDARGAVGALTPELLRTRAWHAATFRPYDVRAEVPFVGGARRHPYLEFLREFEEVLVGLGFSQSEGPLLETEFWNADVLFMPQEHPARSIHDMLTVRGVEGHLPSGDLLDRVAAVHEGRPVPGDAEPLSAGWRGGYDRARAARPVLRSQTTAVSARFLAAQPAPPFRMFCLDRNFRRDDVDALHHIDFAQAEGVVGAEGTTLRHLVGLFRELAKGIGIREMKVRPTYFPFTEPSIEGLVKHPRLGWIEALPGGLFRPEVLRPLGVTVPVAAWGIGVSRLAMVALGVGDIRELFLDDLGRLSRGGS